MGRKRGFGGNVEERGRENQAEGERKGKEEQGEEGEEVKEERGGGLERGVGGDREEEEEKEDGEGEQETKAGRRVSRIRSAFPLVLRSRAQ